VEKVALRSAFVKAKVVDETRLFIGVRMNF
jgi:hypothetical protein